MGKFIFNLLPIPYTLNHTKADHIGGGGGAPNPPFFFEISHEFRCALLSKMFFELADRGNFRGALQLACVASVSARLRRESWD